ncbi:MAG: transcription antitermination factor NusB [Gemmatimonadota bacterium]
MTPRQGGESPADEGSAPVDRSRARAWILQVLYRWESDEKGGNPQPITQVAEETFATRVVARRRQPYVLRVARALQDNFDEVDGRLRDSLDNWRLERLSSIDRAVLRLAATEMLFLDDVPPRVSIQEAVRLAEQYGGEESGRFVNGVLDALFKSMAAR